jgi:hypothetical protein
MTPTGGWKAPSDQGVLDGAACVRTWPRRPPRAPTWIAAPVAGADELFRATTCARRDQRARRRGTELVARIKALSEQIAERLALHTDA